MNALKKLAPIFLFLNIIVIKNNLMAMDSLITTHEDPAGYVILVEEPEIEPEKAYILSNNNNHMVVIQEEVIKNIIPLLETTFKSYNQDNKLDNEIRLSLSNEELDLLAKLLCSLNEIINCSCNHKCNRHNNKQEFLMDICTELEIQTLENKNEIKNLTNTILRIIEQFQLKASHIRTIRISKYDIIEHLNNEYSGYLPLKDVNKMLSSNIIITLPYLIWSFISNYNVCNDDTSSNGKTLSCIEMPVMAILTCVCIIYLFHVGCTISENKKKSKTLKKVWNPLFI